MQPMISPSEKLTSVTVGTCVTADREADYNIQGSASSRWARRRKLRTVVGVHDVCYERGLLVKDLGNGVSPSQSRYAKKTHSIID